MTEISKEKPSIDMITTKLSQQWMLGDAAFKSSAGMDVGKTVNTLQIPYPSDDDRHSPLKELFFDFSETKEITSQYPEELLKVRSVTSYNYLLIAPIAINTEFLAYDKRIAKKLGLTIPETFFSIDDFKAVAKKIAKYNSSQPLAKKIAFINDYDSYLFSYFLG